jgi:AraC family transcriptional regulator
MNEKLEMTVAPYLIEPGPPLAEHRRPPRFGVGVDLRTQPPGVVELAALPDHLLKMHAGAPVRGFCGLGRRFHYRRGDLDIFPAGSASVWEDEESSTSVYLRLPPALLREAAQESGLGSERAGLEPRYQFRNTQIEHVAWALEAECRAGFPNGGLYIDSLGMALALQLLGGPHTPRAIRRGLARRQLQRVTDYIEANIADDLSLVRLAEVAGFSASHFRALFKRSTGLPVHEYVIQCRVEHAHALLARGKLPASQVAQEAGFAHQSHMARCMRRILGVTPTTVVRDAQGVAVSLD